MLLVLAVVFATCCSSLATLSGLLLCLALSWTHKLITQIHRICNEIRGTSSDEAGGVEPLNLGYLGELAMHMLKPEEGKEVA